MPSADKKVINKCAAAAPGELSPPCLVILATRSWEDEGCCSGHSLQVLLRIFLLKLYFSALWEENLLITRFIVDARFMHIKWILSGADFEADVAGVGGEAGHVPSLDVVGDVLPSFARVFAVKTLERLLHLDHAVLHLLAEVGCCHPSWQWQEATDETHWYRMQK